jgi:2,3-bisphosphoglycerate-dependent phosphoglycerate mutase
VNGRLVLLRHGQSTWNQENRFTGWVDVALTEKGEQEARRAGARLLASGVLPDVAHTSLLRRAINTVHHVLEETDRLWIPQTRSWRLNERHYGALAGLDRGETAAIHGEDQVRRWRRSYNERPPLLGAENTMFADDPRYRGVETDLPRGESLADVQARLLGYYEQAILPDVTDGRTVLVGAHGNTLRALVMHIEQMTVEEIENFEIPTGIPRVYQLTRGNGEITYSAATVLDAD